MKLNNKIFIPFLLLVLMLETSCSRAIIRKNLGVKQDAPDEFMVEPKSKLIIPEDISFDLPEPQSAKKKKFEKYNAEESLVALFGESEISENENNFSPLEIKILKKSKALKAKRNIRELVEEDYKNRSSILGTEPGSFLESLVDPFGYNRVKSEVIDGQKENARIRKLIAKSKAG
ncbi:MAG: DUF3035 domain-containing protein [Rickettsiales bacterium]|nr:DUF3035 domain-containing protein [Rickettsiales bacterium]